MGGAPICSVDVDVSKVRGIRGQLLRAPNTGLVEDRVTKALLKKKFEMSNLPIPMTLSKILLKVDRLRFVQMHVAEVFNNIAHNTDGLNLDALQDCMQHLHGNLTKAEITELFNFVDIDQSKVISIKEFWIVLSVGSVLEAIPLLITEGESTQTETPNDNCAHVPPSEPPSTIVEAPNESATAIPLTEAAKPIEMTNGNTQTPSVNSSDDMDKSWRECQSFKAFIAVVDKVRDLLHLIVMAYLLFDADGSGFIRKEAVDRLLEEDGHKAGRNTVLETRFKEMDWDANGTIDFGEFVYSFTSWFETEDEQETS